MGKGHDNIDTFSRLKRQVTNFFSSPSEELTTDNLSGRLLAKANKYKASGSNIDEKEFRELLQMYNLAGQMKNVVLFPLIQRQPGLSGLADALKNNDYYWVNN